MPYPREVELYSLLAQGLRVPFVDLREYTISPGILRKIPRDLARKYRCVPIVFNRLRVVLVHDNLADGFRLAVDPGLVWGRGAHERGRVLEFALTTPSALDETLQRRFSLVDAGKTGTAGN